MCACFHYLHALGELAVSCHDQQAHEAAKVQSMQVGFVMQAKKKPAAKSATTTARNSGSSSGRGRGAGRAAGGSGRGRGRGRS